MHIKTLVNLLGLKAKEHFKIAYRYEHKKAKPNHYVQSKKCSQGHKCIENSFKRH